MAGWWKVLMGIAFGMALAMLLACPAAAAEQRVALSIGVSAYKAVPALRNTLNDARGMEAALRRLGFDVEAVMDPDRGALEAAVRRFGKRAQGADAALFFYAGHAVEVAGHNWLLPVSANIRAGRDLRFEAIDLDGVLEQLEGTSRLSIVVLDACRENPFRAGLGGGGRGVDAGNGLARMQAAVGTLIAFATAPGTVADDGRGANSPFTEALLKRIETPGVELRQMFSEVRRDVREVTSGRQVPWEQSAMEGAFYMKPASPPAAAVAASPAPGPGTATLQAPAAEMVFWDSVRTSTDPADFQSYLARFPRGTFADLARNRLARLNSAVLAPPAAAPTAVPLAVPLAALPASPPVVPPAAPKPDASVQPVRPAAAPDPIAAGPPKQEAMARPAQPFAVRPTPGPEAPKLDAAILSRRLGADVPGLSSGERAFLAQRYPEEKSGKALAISIEQASTWRINGVSSAAEAERLALERCQVRYGAPCVLYAVDDVVTAPPAPEANQRRDMPRVRYAGTFDPLQIPGLTERTRASAVVQGYAAASTPKAMALHPRGIVFAVNGAATQPEAEEKALLGCESNPDPGRGGRDGPCYVYASGNQVVLPERRYLYNSKPR